MAYGLSFSDAFFWPDEAEDIAPSELPTSVYQAILSISNEQWEAIARDVFGCDPDYLDPFTVLDRIRQTNTCSNLDSPVEVWIGDEGWYTVAVHDPEA